MKKIFNEFSLNCAWILGSIVSLLGGLDKLLITLLSFIVIDYITGVLQAIYNKKVNSSIGYRGIIKKVLMLIAVAMSYLLQNNIGIPAIREIVICFFVANEGISILENMGKMGVKLPEKLKEILIQLKEKDNERKE